MQPTHTPIILYDYDKHVLAKLPAAKTLENMEALLPVNLQPAVAQAA